MGISLRVLVAPVALAAACSTPPPPPVVAAPERPKLPLPPAGFIPDEHGGELDRAYVSGGREFLLWVGYGEKRQPLDEVAARYARTNLDNLVGCSNPTRVQYHAGPAVGATCADVMHGPLHMHARVVGTGEVNVLLQCTAPMKDEAPQACADLVERFQLAADPQKETTGTRVGQPGWLFDLPQGWSQVRSRRDDEVRWADPTSRHTFTVRNLGEEEAHVVVEAAGHAAARSFKRIDPADLSPWRGHPSLRLTGQGGRPEKDKREVLVVARGDYPIVLVCVEAGQRAGCEGVLSALEWR